MWQDEAQGLSEVMPQILDQREVHSVDREVKKMDLGARLPGFESQHSFSQACDLR